MPTCAQRLDTTAAWHACREAGHTIDVREKPVWWIRYAAEGKVQCVSSHSEERSVAEALLTRRETDAEAVTARQLIGQVIFDDTPIPQQSPSHQNTV